MEKLLSPAARRLRSQHGAHLSWANTPTDQPSHSRHAWLTCKSGRRHAVTAV